MAPRPTRAQLLVAGGVVLLWLGGLVWFRPWIAHNDFAIFRIALERELDGHVRLVGAHSRLGVFHPGPLREWLFALPYWVGGRRAGALPATALALNASWAIWIVARARRLGSQLWAGVCIAGLALLLIALGPDLASPWNPHLAILPVYLACWSAVSVLTRQGDGWVACICASSFAAQLHASALIVGGALLGLALTALLVQHLYVRAARAAGLAVLLWSGPIVDLRKGSDANLIRLATVGADGESVGPADAVGHMSRLLWPGTPLRRVAVRPSVEELSGFHRWWLVLVVLALVAALVRAERRRRLEHVGADDVGREAIQRAASAVALSLIVAAVASIALFVEPAYRYLYGPLQAGAVFALAVAIVGAIAGAIAVASLRGIVRAPGVDWLRSAGAPFAIAASLLGLALLAVTVPRQDGPGEQREVLAVEAAVQSALAERPTWRAVEAVPLDLRGAGDLDAEVLDVALRDGVDARSRRPELGLPAPDSVDGAFGVAMAPARDCLLAQPDVDEIVRGETAAGETFSVIAVDARSTAYVECIGPPPG